MAGINRDMDSYLRRRKGGAFSFASSRPSSDSSWWSGVFSRSTSRESAQIDRAEREQLTAIETDLKARGKEIEHVQEFEEELEEEQEREVSFYHKLRNFFGQTGAPDEDDADFVAAQAAAQAQSALNTPDVQADFRELAQIQMRWLGRMPSRMMQEFKESPDFVKLTEILQRRGVAKKKQE